MSEQRENGAHTLSDRYFTSGIGINASRRSSLLNTSVRLATQTVTNCWYVHPKVGTVWGHMGRVRGDVGEQKTVSYMDAMNENRYDM